MQIVSAHFGSSIWFDVRFALCQSKYRAQTGSRITNFVPERKRKTLQIARQKNVLCSFNANIGISLRRNEAKSEINDSYRLSSTPDKKKQQILPKCRYMHNLQGKWGSKHDNDHCYITTIFISLDVIARPPRSTLARKTSDHGVPFSYKL